MHLSADCVHLLARGRRFCNDLAGKRSPKQQAPGAHLCVSAFATHRARPRRKRTTQPQAPAHSTACESVAADDAAAAAAPPAAGRVAAFQADDGYEEPHVIAERRLQPHGPVRDRRGAPHAREERGATDGASRSAAPRSC